MAKKPSPAITITYKIGKDSSLSEKNDNGYMTLKTDNGQHLSIHESHPRLEMISAAINGGDPVVIMASLDTHKQYVNKRVMGLAKEDPAGTMTFNGAPLALTESKSTPGAYNMLALIPCEISSDGKPQFRDVWINSLQLKEGQIKFFESECKDNQTLCQQWRGKNPQARTVAAAELYNQQIYMKLSAENILPLRNDDGILNVSPNKGASLAVEDLNRLTEHMKERSAEKQTNDEGPSPC